MEINNNYRNTVGWITILSGIIGFVSYFLVAGSVNFNFDFFSNPVLIAITCIVFNERMAS